MKKMCGITDHCGIHIIAPRYQVQVLWLPERQHSAKMREQSFTTAVELEIFVQCPSSTTDSTMTPAPEKVLPDKLDLRTFIGAPIQSLLI